MISQNEVALSGGFFGLGGSEAAGGVQSVEGGRKRCEKGSHRSRRKGYTSHCVRKEGKHTVYRRRSPVAKGSPWVWSRPVRAKSTMGRRSKKLKEYFAGRR